MTTTLERPRSAALRRWLARAVPVAAIAALAGSAASLDQGFPVHDLGHFGGGYAQAADVNERGDVVGGASDANGNYLPFVVTRETYTWFRDQDGDGRNDLMLDLGTLGGTNGTAYGINSDGSIVGASDDADGVMRAFVVDAHGMTDIGGPAGELSRAYDINDDGVVVGEAGLVIGGSFGQAVVWKGGRTAVTGGTAFAVNTAGQVAGAWGNTAFFVSPSGGAWFRDTTPQDGANDFLVELGEGEIRGMNDSGILVGRHNSRAAIFQGIWRELAGLPGMPFGYALDVNSFGQVVAYAIGPTRQVAYLYLPKPDYGLDAGIHDLTKLLSPGSGWTLEYATAINDEGIVVGWGTHLGKTAAFVLELGGSVLCDPPPPDVPANHAFSGESGDPVNTYTGDFVLRDRPDLDLGGPARLAFSRYYCSGLSRSGFAGSLGDGWIHDFEATLTVDATSAVAVLPQGRSASFARAGTAWILAGSRDVPFQLVDSGGGHVLLDPRQDRIWTFDSQGVPVSIEDATGNVLTLTHAAGRLAQVTDGLGRSLAFAYDAGGLLTSVSDGTRTVRFRYTGTLLTESDDAAGGTTTYAYDDRGRMTGRTLPAGNTPYSRTYSSRGRVVDETDAAGHVTRFAYDGVTDTTVVTDPLGRTSHHLYDANGALYVSIDTAGRPTGIGSDADGRRNSVTDPLGAAARTTFHPASGKVASLTDEGGGTTTLTYAARSHASGVVLHDLAGVSFPDGTSESYVYDATGLLTRRTDRAGAQWTYVHTRSQTPPRAVTRTVESNPLGGATTRDFDADGTLASVTDAAGNVTTYGYDSLRRRVSVGNPDGTTRLVAWDAMDRVTSTTLEDGVVFTRTYDANGNLASAVGAQRGVVLSHDAMDRLTGVQFVDRSSGSDVPVGGAAAATWDALGRVATLTRSGGNAVAYTYDAAGRESRIDDQGGVVSVHEFDDAGRVTSSANALGAAVASEYDAEGRLTRRTSPAGRVVTYEYDAMGRIARRTSGRGVVAFERDAHGLPSKMDVGGVSASYERNALGAITKLIDPNGNAWLAAYDAQGRMTSSTDPLGGVTSYTLDQRGRRRVVSEPGGGTLTYSYDGAGNVTRVEHSDGTALDFIRDARGRLTSTDGVALTRDARGRVTGSNGIAVRRDAAGRIAGVTLAPGREVTYAYDVRGRLTQVADWVGGTTDLAWDGAGRLTSITRPNGVATTFAYDDDGFLTGIADATAAAALASVALTRDARGLVADATRTGPAAPEPALVEGAVTATYDAASQTAAVVHDGVGRVLDDGRRTYAWDGLSRLRSFAEGGTTVALAYDGAGSLVRADDGTTDRRFVWSYATARPSIAVERRGTTDVRYFVCTPSGELLHSVPAAGGARRFHHFDERDNTSFTTDDAGAVEAAYAYSPYGELLADTSGGQVANPFLFMGRRGVLRLSASGLHCAGARPYDAATGRFLSRDPLATIGPLSAAPYAYAAGNPMAFVDSTGEAPEITNADVAGTVANTYASVASDVAGAASKKLDSVAKAAGDGPGGRALKEYANRVARLDAAQQKVGEAAFVYSAGVELMNTRQAGADIKARRDAVLSSTMDRFDARFREARAQCRAGTITPEQYEKLVLDNNRALLEEIDGISEGTYYEESLAYTEGGLKALGTATPVSGSMWDRLFDWLK